MTRRSAWRHFLVALPEAIALVLVVCAGQSLVLGLASDVLLRLAWVASELIHGAGHTLMRAWVDRDLTSLRLANVLEHRSLLQILRMLQPFAPIGPLAAGHLPLPWLETGQSQPWKVRIKASGGLVLQSVVLLLAAAFLLAPAPGQSQGVVEGAFRHWLMALVVANGWMVLASRSDHQAILTGQAELLFCGNFGFLASPDLPSPDELMSERAIHLYRQMGRETELRGTQAGGGLVMARDRRGQSVFVGHKVVNAKRGDLTNALEVGFRRCRRRARLRRIRPHPRVLLACWHYRFGTSGPPAVRETHWQEWTPPQRRRLHRWVNGAWLSEPRIVHHRITHNGDFEALELCGTRMEGMGDLGPWLASVLGYPVPAVVDSARIAGMMDLLICQGDWFAAVRWGFLLTFVDVAPPPPLAALADWASAFEQAFLQQLGESDDHTPDSRWMERLLERLLSRLSHDPLLSRHPEKRRRLWILRSIDAFLHNTPERAVREFMDRARGSFGLVVVSTTAADHLVLSSLGQPITLGQAPASQLAPYASEATAVDAVLAGEPGAWRLDLDQNAGEIAVLTPQTVRITSLSLDRELTREEVRKRQQPYGAGQGDDPPVRGAVSLPHRPGDPVLADLLSIPSLLGSSMNDWSNPGACNRQSADALAQLLITKAYNVAAKQSVLREAGLDPSLARSSHLDLLITGVENSLWLGEQFSSDLTALMPLLGVRALSANAVLHALQHDFESLALARQSVVLVLSHSGQTFPSRQVMEACDLLVRRGVIREVFVLVGEPESLQGSAILAEKEPGEPFSRRLFTTGAGRRRAEPATAVVAAMHQTLTALLFQLADQLLKAFPDARQRPLGMMVARDELHALEEQENAQLLLDSRAIVGVDARAQPRPSPTSRQLARAGRRWGEHVQETPIAWGIHALYIAISVGFGVPLVQTLIHPLETFLPFASLPRQVLFSMARDGDIALYIFGPWLWTLLLRFAQGRPLLARTGRRTVVVGDVPWIHKLLTNYISKLFALSFGIASVDVQGDQAADHLLHTQAHRVVRGSLLFLGLPDGRLGQLQRAEADAVLLAGRQSDGIRHMDTGPEIIGISTDPSIEAGPFQRALVLPWTQLSGGHGEDQLQSHLLLARLRESRYGAFRRLLAGQVFFWTMARQVATLPLLRYQWWKSQSRTKIMTTAAPVSAAGLDVAEPREIVELSLDKVANREQS